MAQANVKDALRSWNRWCETVQTRTIVTRNETAAQKKARIKHLLADYAAFVNYYFPHHTDDEKTGKHTDCAPFHIKAANTIRRTRNLKYVAEWARGHAKSTHFDVFIPLWLKAQEVRELNVMVLVSKSQEMANTLLGDIQAELEFNQRYIADFGAQKNEDRGRRVRS